MTKLEKQTAQNRMEALFDLHGIIAYAEGQINRARNIPLLDDEEHADWVQGYADRIAEICEDMKELSAFGHNGGMQ